MAPSWKTLLSSKSHPLRAVIQNRIEMELRARHPFRIDWQNKCYNMAYQLEEVLFKIAQTLDEFQDDRTISQRLATIAMAKRGKIPMEILSKNLLDKAETQWLDPKEIDWLFQIFGPTRPLNSSISLADDPPFAPDGKIYYVWSHALRDGIQWQQKIAQANGSADECVLIFAPNDQPQIWMSQCVDKNERFVRRTFWSIRFLGLILVHYLELKGKPTAVTHGSKCNCIRCKNLSSAIAIAQRPLMGSFGFEADANHPIVSSETKKREKAEHSSEGGALLDSKQQVGNMENSKKLNTTENSSKKLKHSQDI